MLSIKSLDTTNKQKKNGDKEKQKKEDIEYSLNIHIFNPSKNSPPNSWEIRLKNRIDSFNNIHELIL